MLHLKNDIILLKSPHCLIRELLIFLIEKDKECWHMLHVEDHNSNENKKNYEKLMKNKQFCLVSFLQIREIWYA